jgi:hypothetical protein
MDQQNQVNVMSTLASILTEFENRWRLVISELFWQPNHLTWQARTQNCPHSKKSAALMALNIFQGNCE